MKIEQLKGEVTPRRDGAFTIADRNPLLVRCGIKQNKSLLVQARFFVDDPLLFIGVVGDYWIYEIGIYS